eukprot:TCONS_00017911-protein
MAENLQESEENLVTSVTNADLESFINHDPEDIVYKEFENDPNVATDPHFKWKCMKTVFLLNFFGAFGVGLLSILCVYFDLNFSNLCDSTKWINLPHNIKIAHLYSKAASDQIYLFWYVINLLLVFEVSKIQRQVLILANLLAGCVCTIWRLSTVATDLYGKSSLLGAPQFLIFIVMSIYTTSVVLKERITTGFWRRLIVTLNVNNQIIIAFVFYLVHFYVILPTFIKASIYIRLAMAFFIPVVGYGARILCRVCLQHIKHILHPGRLYILSAGLHALTVTLYRILQASVQSTWAFIALGLAHSVVGFIDKISVLYQRSALSFVCRKFCFRVYRVKRNPREMRESADILILNLVYELWGVMITCFTYTLYAVQHSIPLNPKIEKEYTQGPVIRDLMYRIIFTICVETISSTLAVFWVIKKSNFAIIKLWTVKWKLYCFVLAMNAIFPLILASKTLVNITEESFTLFLIDSGRQDLASKLKMCNYTSRPY